MKILITGATGFLGGALVKRLVGNHDLRLLVRARAARAGFPETVSFVDGDITDGANLERALVGVDAVIHAAALVKILAPAAEFDRVNVFGLENVLAAAQAAGVGKIVYVSSFMALGPSESAPGGVLDESAPEDERTWINDYERTKTLADRRARAAITQGLPLSVIYPGVIYGPGALTEGNIIVRHVLDLAHKRLPALLGRPERVWNYVFVDDVADGIARVLEVPAGQRFVLGGENLSQANFYDTIAQVTGLKVPTLRMPDALATFSGFLMKSAARLTGGTPKLTPDLVEVYRHDWAYDSRAAEEQLLYRPRKFAAGLRTTFEWLQKSGEWPG